jgi:hypothetical protein
MREGRILHENRTRMRERSPLHAGISPECESGAHSNLRCEGCPLVRLLMLPQLPAMRREHFSAPVNAPPAMRRVPLNAPFNVPPTLEPTSLRKGKHQLVEPGVVSLRPPQTVNRIRTLAQGRWLFRNKLINLSASCPLGLLPKA